MHLSIVFVAFLSLIKCIAALPLIPFPIISGHEVRLPYRMLPICGIDMAKGGIKDDYLSLEFFTQNNSKMVNNHTILPDHLLSRIPITIHAKLMGTDRDTLSLLYRINIRPVEQFPSGTVAENFILDILLFGPCGHPVNINKISVGILCDIYGSIQINRVAINSSVTGSNSKGNGTPRAPVPSEPSPSTKCTGLTHAPRHKYLLHKWLDAGRSLARSYKAFRFISRSRPSMSHCPNRYSLYLPSHPGRKSVSVARIIRVLYTASLPFSLGIAAGGVICLTGVIICRFTGPWFSGSEKEGGDSNSRNGRTQNRKYACSSVDA